MTRLLALMLAAAPIAAWAQAPVTWETLAQVQLVANSKNYYVPRYADAVLKLDAREVKLQGFMMPLSVGEKQTHFLLVANPADCGFCMSSGPEGTVEVRSKAGLKYGLDPIVVRGRLEVLKNDPNGMFYRLHDAVPAAK
jgi:uncharacterized protein